MPGGKVNLLFLSFAATACLLPFAPNIARAAPAREVALRWNDLQPVLTGRQISVHLTDGATVEGRYSSLQADALSIQVKKTSDPAKYPKGAALLARREVAGITVMRRVGSKGRVIGLIAGGAIAAVAAGVIHGASTNEVGGWSSGSAGVAAAGGAAVVGVGYLAGWLLDSAHARPEAEVRILPDDPVR
jgi:hypothetical protein